jgi:hypothetical protein
MTCRPPTPPLDALIVSWPPTGFEIHTIHNTDFEPQSFNPGVSTRPTRFAPICDSSDKPVPYLYGGSSLDCAIFETIFHNIPLDATDKFVDLDDFADRAHGVVRPQRDLRLVDLTTDGLHRLKIPKSELIESPPADYVDTARWAQALHQQYPEVDGLFWMSCQRDQDRALILFGDRAGSALDGSRRSGRLSGDDTLRRAILTLALRVGIEAD